MAGKTTRERYPRRQIDFIAQTILEKLGCMQYPIDPIAIATTLGIEVKEATLMKDVSGLIDPLVPKIIVAAGDSFVRKRFSVAHELGHYILHYHGEEGKRFSDKDLEQNHISYRNTVSSLGYSTTEIEANHFAAALLMPESKVREVCDACIPGDEFMIECATDYFYVSRLAASIRLQYLGLICE